MLNEASRMTIDDIEIDQGIDIPTDDVVIETEESATIAISRMAAVENKMARILMIRDAELLRIAQWANNEIDSLRNAYAFFAAPLESFMRARNRQDPKVKSLKYPNGTIGVRMTPDRIEIDEDANLPALAMIENDPLIIVTKSFRVDKKAILGALKQDGMDIPEYATLVPGEKKFYIKLTEGDPK